MKPYETKGCSQYGASLGRGSDINFDYSGALSLDRVPLTDGGCYDPGGAYWGQGQTLWCAYNEDGEGHHFRAETAKAARARFPHARWEKDGNLDEFLGGLITEALADLNSAEENDGRDTAEEDALQNDTLVAFRSMAEQFFASTYGDTSRTVLEMLGSGLTEECDLTFKEAGERFWNSNTGSGCGFSDLYGSPVKKALGAALHKAARGIKPRRSYYLYYGDDGKVYLS